MYLSPYVVYALVALVAIPLLIRVPVIGRLVRGLLFIALSLLGFAIDLSLFVLAWFGQRIQILKAILA